MSILRSTAAVVAGLVTATLLVVLVNSGATALMDFPESPPGRLYLVINLAGSALAGMAGGAVAGRLAPHAPHGHVLALAIVILALSLPSFLAGATPGQPEWYPLVLSVLGPSSVLLGGVLTLRRRPQGRPRLTLRSL